LGKIWHGGVGPDLAVWVGVAGAHHGAAILENLHIVDGGERAQLGVLLGPEVHHVEDGGRVERGEPEVVTRGIADNSAGTGLATNEDEAPRVAVDNSIGSLWQKRGKIVVKNKRGLVPGIMRPIRASVARAHVTSR